jgi:hypothetical protein
MPQFLQNILDPIQMIGYIGTFCALASFQSKKNRTYFWLQMGCSAAFLVQFALLHSWAGMLLNVFSILRCVVMVADKKFGHPAYMYLIQLCFAASSIVSVVVFGEHWWIAAMLFAAQAAGTFAMWSRNGKTIRIAQLCLISPIWMIHNIYYFSIGGIACETFNVCSIIVSFIRFRKSGFDKT